MIDDDPAERRQLIVHLLRASCTVLVIADEVARADLLLAGRESLPAVIISTLCTFKPLACAYVSIISGIDVPPTLILLADPLDDRSELLALGAQMILERPINEWSLQRIVADALAWRRLRVASQPTLGS